MCQMFIAAHSDVKTAPRRVGRASRLGTRKRAPERVEDFSVLDVVVVLTNFPLGRCRLELTAPFLFLRRGRRSRGSLARQEEQESKKVEEVDRSPPWPPWAALNHSSNFFLFPVQIRMLQGLWNVDRI